jgi:hypothetical protein
MSSSVEVESADYSKRSPLAAQRLFRISVLTDRWQAGSRTVRTLIGRLAEHAEALHRANSN